MQGCHKPSMCKKHDIWEASYAYNEQVVKRTFQVWQFGPRVHAVLTHFLPLGLAAGGCTYRELAQALRWALRNVSSVSFCDLKQMKNKRRLCYLCSHSQSPHEAGIFYALEPIFQMSKMRQRRESQGLPRPVANSHC